MVVFDSMKPLLRLGVVDESVTFVAGDFLAAVDVATLAVAVVIIAIVIQSNRLLSLQLLT